MAKAGSNNIEMQAPQQCPAKLKERLRAIEVQHYDFDGKINTGTIVVFDVVAESVINVFKKLFDLKFPIQKMQPMENYEWNDDWSMDDNNSSCFNYRTIAGTQKLSIHSYGVAIDINPRQNPFIKAGVISPKLGGEFVDRSNQRPGMLEPIVSIFKENGFTVWGGDWDDPKDYHHFQPTREVAESLVGMDYEQGM